MLEVRLLGNFDVKQGKKTVSIPSRQAQSLFAFLILNAGTAYRREKLAGQLWPDSTEESARDYLRHALWRIRKELKAASAGTYLQADDLTVLFNGSSDYWLDAAALREADEKGPIEQLAQALSGYGGELLPGFYDEWVVLEREHLQAVYERKVGCLLESLNQAGRWQEVLEWAEKWIALGQKPESAYRHLMSAYAAQGDLVKVATAFERCVKSLAEFGFQPSEQTRRLQEDLKAGRGPKPAQPKPAPVESGGIVIWNVPRPLTSFIGREREIAEIVRILEAHRLITLTGPGGVGKTRLAIQLASRMRDNFTDGVCWVELAPISDPNLVPQAIASSLSVREAAGQSLTEALRGYLASRKLLLILDNCEHLILACAQIVDLLAGACAYLRILTTSREALGILGERVFEVPTLSVPQPQRLTLIDVLLEYESVRLFIERARVVQSDFGLTEKNAAAVGEICQRLDGIPLALELAAARTKLLTVEHIAERLNDRFSLLTQGSRTALPRQQTLRATIDWSYEQLPDEARILFRRLSVFAGGFTMEAAEAICSGSPLSPAAVFELLSRLVDRSLVKVERQGGDPRYNILETIRQYSQEKLQTAGEDSTIRTLHLEFALHQAEQAEPKLLGGEQKAALAEVDAEYGNLRSALEWAMETDPARALQLAAALGQFWEARGYVSEGRIAIERALQQADNAPGEVRAKGLQWEGELATRQADYSGAQAALEESMKLFRGLGNKRGLANSLRIFGNAIWAQGNYVAAQTSYEESLALLKEIGDKRGIALLMNNLGNVSVRRGDYATARRYEEESVAIFRELGDKVSLVMALNNLGVVAEEQGDGLAAKRFYEESIALSRELGEKSFVVYALNGLAHVICLQGDLVNARHYYQESLVVAQEIGEKRIIVYSLEGFAKVAGRQGNLNKAARLFGAADALRQAIGAPLDPAERAELDQDVSSTRSRLGEEAFISAWTDGSAMTLEQAAAFALEQTHI